MPHEKIEDGYTGNLVYVCAHTEGLTNFTTTQPLYLYNFNGLLRVAAYKLD